MTAEHQQVARALVLAQQRTALVELGRRLGTPVLFLKAAWADPVLYGGRGARTGCDLDVLVPPESFRAVAAALEEEGYRRAIFPRHRATNDAEKEWSYVSPHGAYPVDLHRALVSGPWFRLPTREIFSRARDYDSVDGVIASLSPEDQVVFAAAHYANHRFDLDERHLEDIVRLLATYAVDWDAIIHRCAAGWLSLALWLVGDALARRGAAVPRGRLRRAMGRSGRLRRRWLECFIAVGPTMSRKKRFSARAEVALLMPAITDRATALPRFIVRYARYRVMDVTAAAAEIVAARGRT